MTYGDLQEGQAYGFLYDPETNERFSADRRDYWYCADSDEIDGLVLAREHSSIEILSAS